MRLLRLPEVIERTGLARMTIWRMEIEGRFPPRRQIGDRAVAWVESEVDDWIASLPTVLPAATAPAETTEAP